MGDCPGNQNGLQRLKALSGIMAGMWRFNRLKMFEMNMPKKNGKK
jgi:hypothetical protein